MPGWNEQSKYLQPWDGSRGSNKLFNRSSPQYFSAVITYKQERQNKLWCGQTQTSIRKELFKKNKVADKDILAADRKKELCQP